MSNSNDTLPTLVVGGGIGGLATALAIAHTGRDVHLIEQAPEFTEIGAGLQVGPNATRMLDRLKVLDQVLELAVMPARGVMLDAVTGDQLTVLDLGPSFRERYGYPYMVVHRSDLLTILLQACREHPSITLENNKAVAEVWSEGDRAGVKCLDGSLYESELLLGADGLNSRVRTLIDDSAPRNSGYVAYRGTLPMSDMKSEVSDNDVVLWVGPGMHLIQYPIRRHELYNQVAVIRSDRFHRGEDVYGTPDELVDRFSIACADVQRSIARISTDRSWPILDRDPLHTWVHGRAALLGDAAHPMLQYLGQGACQALEDAHTLAQEVTANRDDLPAALASYQDRRIQRTTRCQLSARPWGDVWHTGDPAMLALRNRVLRSRSPNDYSELDWLYLDPDLEPGLS